MDKRLVAAIANKSPESIFTREEVESLQCLLSAFAKANGRKGNQEIDPGQPFLLDILLDLGHITNDSDTGVILQAKAKVHTGVIEPISYSGVFRQVFTEPATAAVLTSPEGNWASAYADTQSTQALIDKEVKAGFVVKFDGDLDDAKARWPGQVAKGKLSVSTGTGKDPRLALDSTIPGVNPGSQRHEATEKPSVQDAASTETDEDSTALTLDVKSAHKLLRLHDSEHGLVLFEFLGILCHYLVCHFGASFSDYWWGRLGAFLHRLIHRLVYVRHSGLLFVDDWL